MSVYYTSIILFNKTNLFCCIFLNIALPTFIQVALTNSFFQYFCKMFDVLNNTSWGTQYTLNKKKNAKYWVSYDFFRSQNAAWKKFAKIRWYFFISFLGCLKSLCKLFLWLSKKYSCSLFVTIWRYTSNIWKWQVRLITKLTNLKLRCEWSALPSQKN